MEEKIILSKTLKITDAETRFTMKTKCLEYFPPFGEGQLAQDILVQDEDGKEWPFRLIIRKGKYRKPVLSAGWLHFVRIKNLKAGFMVQLIMKVEEDTGEVHYKIKLMKPVTLFKSVIGYAPYSAA